MPSLKAARKQHDIPQPAQGQAEALSPHSHLFTWRRWLVLVCCGMLLIASRTPMDWLHPTFYAEDGMIFFREQFLEGWHVIFRTYNGYFHLIPRLATFVASAAPVRDQPLIFSLFNLVIQSLAASFFFLPENRIFVRSDSLRLVVCILALIDFQGDQMLNNVMDVQWFLFPVAVLMLCQMVFRQEPWSRNRILVYSALMIAICLTTPLLLIALPLALFVLVRSRGLEKLIPASMIAAITVQGIAFLKTGVPEQHATAAPPFSLFLALRPLVATMGAWAYRDVFTIVLGERAAKLLALHGGETLAALVLASAVFAACYISPRLPRVQRVLFLSAALTSIGLVGTSLVVRRMLDFFGDLTNYNFFGGGARYFFISGWIVLVVGAMAVEYLGANWSQFGRAALLAAMFGLGALSNFAVDELPNEHWSDNAPAIERWRIKRDRHEPAAHVNAPIFPPNWSVYLPDL